MKNIEWLKEKVQEKLLEDKLNGINYFDYKRLKEDIWNFIDQLDEPETLSQEWIDNHTAGADTIAHYSEEDVPVVTVSDLEKLLVPKLDLPEIPDYVAEWIEASKKSTYHLVGAIYDGAYNEDIKEWLFKGDKRIRRHNQNKLTRAWLDGYTVEEKKYRVLNNCDIAILAKTNEGKVLTTEIEAYKKIEGLANVMRITFELTEQEIKDYDERYFAFAVPVDGIDNALSDVENNRVNTYETFDDLLKEMEK